MAKEGLTQVVTTQVVGASTLETIMDAVLRYGMKIIEATLASDGRVLAEPATFVGVSNLGDSSVDFTVRPWVASSDFWQFKCDFTQKIKERFDAEGVSIPFPQRDVHLFSEHSKNSVN